MNKQINLIINGKGGVGKMSPAWPNEAAVSTTALANVLKGILRSEEPCERVFQLPYRDVSDSSEKPDLMVDEK